MESAVPVFSVFNYCWLPLTPKRSFCQHKAPHTPSLTQQHLLTAQRGSHRTIRGMALDHPPPAIPALWYPAFLRQGTTAATEVRQAQNGGTFPQGQFPSGVTLIWQDSAPRKQRLRKQKTEKDATKGGVEGGSDTVNSVPSGLIFTKVLTHSLHRL